MMAVRDLIDDGGKLARRVRVEAGAEDPGNLVSHAVHGPGTIRSAGWGEAACALQRSSSAHRIASHPHGHAGISATPAPLQYFAANVFSVAPRNRAPTPGLNRSSHSKL